MDVKKAINERRSIRGFAAESVSQETVREVLQLATRAVSATNSQPWEIHVVTGRVLADLCRANVDCFRSGQRTDWPDPETPGVYRTRRVGVAKQLFGAMEIAREDKERRTWWSERGYRFFDAPVGILICLDNSLDETTYRFDIGCVAQNICVAAMEYGLGTCVAYQPVLYQSGARKLLDIPDNKYLVCGIAMGYPDWSFPANRVITPREDLDAVTTWHGFD